MCEYMGKTLQKIKFIHLGNNEIDGLGQHG